MKAAVVVTPGTIEIQDVADPAPGPSEVVVKPAAVGICGTDLHIMDGEFAPSFPIVPGHEFAGEIVAVGSAVTGYAVGDQVAVDPSLYCGYCYYCKRARGNQCENWAAIGVTVSGGAAEFVAAPLANLFKLPSHLAARDAALIEPLSCAVRGFDVLPRAMATSYLIYGSGTMGLMMLELAKRAGAESVSIVDLNPARLETAKRLGCTAAVTSADELDAPRGWDVVIDCTGVEAAIRDGLARVGRGGTFLQFGVASYDARLAIEPYEIYRREITITGSMAVLHSFDRAGQMLAAGVLDPSVFVSHRFPLSDYAAALDQFRAGVGRKILIEP
ncbi:zinc-dependent alcohol dehydrogenase family protein [Paractinoplanes brasiliensis]|uniref:2-desacetyl-2-hydroxyethyl bacteriochlorophyllide A dehydrogenase n=1 Tax=Paractinoplanes brasiliensis TaxID=52695 RepID=A0A4R6JRJ1_9ACTN|nr:zinc-dependent alcohol dehydrogenase family protein [Actinoplanes brasiliensis]TDO39049.1 2-desacetyl-2-hydroxyethyl bacteriochlorophyllide A dehydrogenase [Actinoplanes brasiliensis]GID30252.1 alcohol dehydrogenase [Actinoplanes brasiliensis]